MVVSGYGTRNPNSRSVWIVNWAMLKNKLHLVTFLESILVSLWTTQIVRLIKLTLEQKDMGFYFYLMS